MRWLPPRSIILFLVYQIMGKKTKKERRKERKSEADFTVREIYFIQGVIKADYMASIS